MNCYQAEANHEAAKRKAQPIAHALMGLLSSAADIATGDARKALQVRAIGIAAHCARTWQDITQDEAVREMIAAGLAPEGTEPYAVFVAGKRVGAILARNRYHAVNKAKKEFGLHVAEYRHVCGEHEIHGARFEAPDPTQAEALFARIASIDAASVDVPFAPTASAPLAHVAGIERREGQAYSVRASCSCGWRGIWHRSEPQTRVGARAHREAYGLGA